MTPALRWTPRRVAIAYAAILLMIGAFDALWLGWLAGDLYREEMGSLMAASPRLVPAAAFYLLYPLALIALPMTPLPATSGKALLRCAAFGLAAYGTYDLTNMAVISGFSIKLGLIDWAWGGVATGLAGTVGHALARRSRG